MYICAKARAIFRELAGVKQKREAEVLRRKCKKCEESAKKWFTVKSFAYKTSLKYGIMILYEKGAEACIK